MPADLEGQRWLIHLAASGHIRTRHDAETMILEIEEKGWKQDLRVLYYAVVGLLLPGAKAQQMLESRSLSLVDRALAKTIYNGLVEHYLGNRPCQCSPASNDPSPTCPAHGRTVNAEAQR